MHNMVCFTPLIQINKYEPPSCEYNDTVLYTDDEYKLENLHLLKVTVSWSFQISSVAQSCPTLCGPMNRSMPGLPVHHQLPEFTETHVHRVSDAIQPSYPLSSPSPPAPNPSQHQSLINK